MDETGFTLSDQGSRRVIGRRGTKRQYQQGSGDRENTTVLVTICADGTALRPTIIFKGHNHMKKWSNNNVSNASICHSPNGWTDTELAINWFKKDFEPQTREKAAGEFRLLLLDGHSSHYPTELLHYAQTVDVLIAGYPSHTTHALQGLDVVCFSRMKDMYRHEVKTFEEENQRKMNKGDFAAVFGRAFQRAFTPTIIKMVFRPTGVHPFSPNIINEKQFKPSEALSVRNAFPLPQPSLVRRVMATYSALAPAANSSPLAARTNMQPFPDMESIEPFIDPALFTPSKQARIMAESLLQSTSGSYLVSSDPIKSHHLPFAPVLEAPPRVSEVNWNLL
ncbi:hypothetical protein M422DRAFT_189346, partial [Sphaerobolus stellatus SS14]